MRGIGADPLKELVESIGLPLATGWTSERLAQEVSNVVATARPVDREAITYRDVANVLADAAEKLRQAADALRALPEAAISELALSVQLRSLIEGHPPAWARIEGLLVDLPGSQEELAGCLAYPFDAMSDPGQSSVHWRRSDAKSARILRAALLVPIFEEAFSISAKANGYPSDKRHKRPTPFMEFVKGIGHLSGDEGPTTDLPVVCREGIHLFRRELQNIARWEEERYG